MDNFAQAYVQFGDHKLTTREDFHSGTVYSRFPVIKSHFLKTNLKLN